LWQDRIGFKLFGSVAHLPLAFDEIQASISIDSPLWHVCRRGFPRLQWFAFNQCHCLCSFAHYRTSSSLASSLSWPSLEDDGSAALSR
jgi:hypothetical protein